MIEKKTWEEFREDGLFWFVNRMLHLVGWTLVLETDLVEMAQIKYWLFGLQELSGSGSARNKTRKTTIN